MGEVWLALDEKLFDRPVAIKIIRSHMLADQDGLRRFQQEMRLTCAMHHPNIVTVFTSGTDHGIPFMVMEYLEGHDLTKVPPGWGAGEVARVGREACAALAYAHTLNVVHRDITPRNLFLCDTGLVKVTDFGIAKALTGSKITQPGTVIGVLAYMAPEQWLGEPATFGIDVWAVGCVLYELLSGRLPREYSTPVEYVAAAARGEHVAPLPGTANVPSWLRDAVMAMLQPDPGSRPAAADCVQLLSGPAAKLSQVSPPRPARTSATPAGNFATTGTIEVGLGGRTDWVNRNGGMREKDSAAREDSLRSAAPAPLNPTGAGVTAPPTRRRGRRRLAVVAAVAVISAFASYAALFVIGGHSRSFSPKASVPPIVLTDPRYAAASVAFSPTGQLLAIGGRAQFLSPDGGSIYLWELATRRIVATLTDPAGKGVDSVAFGPGGSTLAAGDLDGTTYMWNLAARKITARLADPGGQQVDSVAFSPDGATLAVGDDNGNTYVWNLADQKIIATLYHPQSGVAASVPTVSHSVAFGPGGTTLADAFYGCTFVWNLAERRVISPLCDPGSYGVISVGLDPGGKILATADANGVTFLWDLATRTVAARFYIRNTEAADAVAFGPGDDLLAVGQENGTVYLWQLSQ